MPLCARLPIPNFAMAKSYSFCECEPWWDWAFPCSFIIPVLSAQPVLGHRGGRAVRAFQFQGGWVRSRFFNSWQFFFTRGQKKTLSLEDSFTPDTMNSSNACMWSLLLVSAVIESRWYPSITGKWSFAIYYIESANWNPRLCWQNFRLSLNGAHRKRFSVYCKRRLHHQILRARILRARI